MKQKHKRRLDEGGLVAAALGVVLLLSLLIWMNRQPRLETVAPVCSVSAAELERAARVNVNAADAAELDRLPGVGEVMAGRIIAYREANGPFASVEDLLNVKGVGEKTLAKLRDEVRLE